MTITLYAAPRRCGAASRTQAEHARKELQDLLAILDHRLDSRDHMLGGDFTLVKASPDHPERIKRKCNV